MNRAAGRETSFLVSGALMDNNLIMFDVETRTTWPQLLLVGNAGTRAGDCLVYRRNNAATTWDLWRRLHPETLVLSNQNQHKTAVQPDWYLVNPYRDYHADIIKDPPNPIWRPSSRLPQKEIVFGVHANGGRAAVLMRSQIAETRIGLTDVLFFRDPPTNTIFAFENRAGGLKRAFAPVDPGPDGAPRFRDTLDGTLWTLDGVAVEGPSAGLRMPQLPALHLYWFAWNTFFPGSDVIFL